MAECIIRSVRCLLLLTLCFGAFTRLLAEEQPIMQARVLLEHLSSQSGTSEVVRISKDIGAIVDRVRLSDTREEDLKVMRDILVKMHEQSRQRVINMENHAQENEVALERLYRSKAWEDLSYAQAMFGYWRGWIYLELARYITDEQDKSQILSRSLNVFRIASMQLFRPELAYKAWLGIGYVEIERGNYDRAKQIFRKLEEVLTVAPESHIREVVLQELRLLEARSGTVRKIQVADNIDEQEAAILRIEILTLLEEKRKTGGLARDAEQGVKVLIENGRMDQDLLNQLMYYTEQIVDFDLGKWSDLIAAEFRLRNDDYLNAQRKFEAFFNNPVTLRSGNLDYYRYRWALAAYKAEFYQAAIGVLKPLLRKNQLEIDVDKAASKLLYAVYSAREASDGSVENRRLLHAAAQRFVNKSPEDSDADFALLVIAQTSSGTDTAMELLGGIQPKPKLAADIHLTFYQVIARQFIAADARNKTKLYELAGQGIEAFEKLTEKDKHASFNIAMALRMRALRDADPIEMLKALDIIDNREYLNPSDSQNTVDSIRHSFVEQYSDEVVRVYDLIVAEGNIDLDIHRALLWSRLQIYDRLGDWDRVIAYMLSIKNKGISSWQMELLFPWIATCKDVNQRLELAKIISHVGESQPEMDRRLQKLIIGDLINTGQNQEAFKRARAFTEEYANSGDAWRLLAQSAQRINDLYTADYAWSVITDKTEPSTDIWWEGMLSRVHIRINSTRPKQACSLLWMLDKSKQYLPEERKFEYESMWSGGAERVCFNSSDGRS